MTFTCSRTSLVNELSLLRTVAETKQTIPVLSTVMLGMVDRLTLTATDLDATVITEVEAEGQPWGGCVPCKQLYDLAKLLDGDTLTFTPQVNAQGELYRLEVRAGKSKHLLRAIPISAFPDVQRADGDGLNLPLPLLQVMVRAVSFAMLEPSDSHRPADFPFTGLSLRYVDKLEVMATRKSVTAIAETLADCAPFATILPPVTVAALLKLEGEQVLIKVTDNVVEFSAGPRTIICRPLMGQFPQWRQFVPEYPYSLTVPVDGLTSAIRRAGVTMGTDSAVGYEPMKAVITSEQVLIETRGGDSGKSEEPVTITSNLNGQPVTWGFINRQMLSVLGQCEGTVACRLGDSNQPMMLRPTCEFNVYYVVMPVGLKW